jgi:hypothetical protein
MAYNLLCEIQSPAMPALSLGISLIDRGIRADG